MWNNLLNPSTVEGAYFISISSGLIVAVVTGLVSFNCGKNASSLKQKGDGNIGVQNGFIMGEVPKRKN